MDAVAGADRCDDYVGTAEFYVDTTGTTNDLAAQTFSSQAAVASGSGLRRWIPGNQRHVDLACRIFRNASETTSLAGPYRQDHSPCAWNRAAGRIVATIIWNHFRFGELGD